MIQLCGDKSGLRIRCLSVGIYLDVFERQELRQPSRYVLEQRWCGWAWCPINTSETICLLPQGSQSRSARPLLGPLILGKLFTPLLAICEPRPGIDVSARKGEAKEEKSSFKLVVTKQRSWDFSRWPQCWTENWTVQGIPNQQKEKQKRKIRKASCKSKSDFRIRKRPSTPPLQGWSQKKLSHHMQETVDADGHGAIGIYQLDRSLNSQREVWMVLNCLK